MRDRKASKQDYSYSNSYSTNKTDLTPSNRKNLQYGLDESEVFKSQDLSALKQKITKTTTNAELISKYQPSAGSTRSSYASIYASNKGVSSSQELKGTKVLLTTVKAATSSLPKNELKRTSDWKYSAPFMYYVTSLQKHLVSPNEKDYFCQIYKEHLLQSFQALNFVKFAKPIDQRILNSKKVTLNRRKGYEGNLELFIFTKLDCITIHYR